MLNSQLIYIYIPNQQQKMEKYIFDCRQKLNQSPKFLKRNQKVLPHVDSSQHKNKSMKSCSYLKNKVFLTFDYSYYQIIPKTASMHVSNRVNSLNSLVGNSTQDVKHGEKYVGPSIANDFKWKVQKQNGQYMKKVYNERSSIYKKFHKKLKTPINSMPGVGDYYFQPANIQKKIIYDVKIRGKPSEMSPKTYTKPLSPKTQVQQHRSSQNSHQLQIAQQSNNKFNKKLKRSSKSAGGLHNFNKERDNRMQVMARMKEEQYAKFINSIQVSTVWNKLMQKHKLKGSKFDIYGYGQ